jgi:hypothetical protein
VSATNILENRDGQVRRSSFNWSAFSIANATLQLGGLSGQVAHATRKAFAEITKKSFAAMTMLGQTGEMSMGFFKDRTKAGATGRQPRFRRYLAGLMAVVMLAASFAVAARDPAVALPAGNSNASQFVTFDLTSHRQAQPKPCQKHVLPGTINPCPLSSFSFNLILTTGADTAVPVLIGTAPWQLSNSSLPPQCAGFSPYRPPCA